MDYDDVLILSKLEKNNQSNDNCPDMTFSFEMRSGDFSLPAFTIQQIVENA